MIGSDDVVYRWFSGQGLEFHPLASFSSLANARRRTQRRGGRDAALADALARARDSSRSGRPIWEYSFRFGLGRPPWASGMAQALAAQALAARRIAARRSTAHHCGAPRVRGSSAARHVDVRRSVDPPLRIRPRGGPQRAAADDPLAAEYGQIAADNRARPLSPAVSMPRQRRHSCRGSTPATGRCTRCAATTPRSRTSST